MPSRPAPPLLIALTFALALAGCAHRPPHRYFQPSAAQIGPEPNSYGELVLPRHGLVAVQGDDLAYGLATRRSRHRINGADRGQAADTISQTLRGAVRGVKVENRGFPGDTVERSAVRWAGAAPADLTILCFGTGDAAAHTDPDEFRKAYQALVDLSAAHGAVVAVIPPSTSDPLRDSEEAPYREIVRAVARNAGVITFDANASVSRIKAKALPGDALSPAVYQAIAADIAPYVKVLDPPSSPAGSPQAGQAGSAASDTVRASPASPS